MGLIPFYLKTIKIEIRNKGILTMAQHNLVHMFGVVQTEPTVRVNDETGQPEMAMLYLEVATASRRYESSNRDMRPQFIQICVRTTAPDTTAIVAGLHENDLVILKGVVSTKNVTKQVVCKNCGEVFSVREGKQPVEGEDIEDGDDDATSMITYVTPIAIDVRNTNLTEDEAHQMLLKVREMSNEVQLIGNLCADPKPFEGGKATSYQLGVNRKYFQRYDDPSITADYPYIRSLGVQAESDIEALRMGSMVLVDGFLKTRYFDRKSKCPYCGTIRTWTDYCIEVVPYSVEYIRDYKTGKERLEEKMGLLESQDID